MIKNVLKIFCEIDTRIMKIVNIGLSVSFAIGLIGAILVIKYNTYLTTYDFYKAGFILIKTSLTFSAQFVACGIAFDKITKWN